MSRSDSRPNRDEPRGCVIGFPIGPIVIPPPPIVFVPPLFPDFWEGTGTP